MVTSIHLNEHLIYYPQFLRQTHKLTLSSLLWDITTIRHGLVGDIGHRGMVGPNDLWGLFQP